MNACLQRVMQLFVKPLSVYLYGLNGQGASFRFWFSYALDAELRDYAQQNSRAYNYWLLVSFLLSLFQTEFLRPSYCSKCKDFSEELSVRTIPTYDTFFSWIIMGAAVYYYLQNDSLFMKRIQCDFIIDFNESESHMLLVKRCNHMAMAEH